jgi:long-chain acyl-CoA synthetase
MPDERDAPTTVAALIEHAAARYAARPAIVDRGRSWTYAALAERVAAVARGLLARGVAPGDRVALWGENRAEWLVVDLAVAGIGGVVVPIYATSSAAEARFILDDAGATLACCGDPAQAASLVGPSGPSSLRGVVLLSGEPLAGTIALDALAEEGDRVASDAVVTATRAVAPDDDYRIIYTSGTTGAPKGCRLTHGNLVAAIRARAAADPVEPDDQYFLFLPLAHAFGLAVQLMALRAGASVVLATGSMDDLLDQLPEVAPSHLLGIPRFVEKLYSRVTIGHGADEVAAAIADAEAATAAREQRRDVPADVAARIAARAPWLAQVRAATGGRLRRAVVGSAPVDREMLRFFRAAGVLMVQGYGMTETSGFATVSTPEAYRIGAVGRPIPGMELRIGDRDEILLRGPNVFAGYVSGGDGAFGGTEDGWLRTGDAGRVGPDGMLEITGRLKDLIITAGGKNIAPAVIEADLVRQPWIDQAVLCGDARPYVVALVTLDRAALASWAARRGIDAPYKVLVDDPEVRAEVQRSIDAVNVRYARPEQIKRFAILRAPLTVEAGELTASMKVRRATVIEHHQDVIDGLYAATPTA